MIHVQNMKNRSGNPVVNQFIITTDEGKYFQSYDSIIVFIDNFGGIWLGKDWDYSSTTGRYRNIFLGETKKTTLSKIENNTYNVIDL